MGARVATRVLVLVLAVWLIAAGQAAAHGVVERAVPAANSSVTVPPRQIELWFNEPVDPAFSTVTVTDTAGRRVSGPAVVAPDGRQMIARLERLPEGFYTVRWRVLSRVDGHTTSGLFAFTVGLGRPPEGFGGEEAPDPWLVGVRWVGFAALLLLAGAALFPPLVLEPALGRLDPPDALQLEDAARARLRRTTVVAGTLVLAAAATEVVLRAAQLTGVGIAGAVAGGHAATLLWSTKPGWSALVRSAVAVLLLLPGSPRGRIVRTAGLFWLVIVGVVTAMFGGPAGLAGGGHLALVVLVGAVYGLATALLAIILPQVGDVRVPDFPWVAVAAALAALGGMTLNAHAWGGGPAAVLADWIHLAAGTVWIGGLACLLLVLAAVAPAARLRAARALVPRFSSTAAASLAALIVTGAYAIGLHVPSTAALAATGYGRTLVVKLLLVLPLVALAAVNRFVLRPQLASGGEAAPPAQRQFVRVAGAEVGLGAAILLATAALTAWPPAAVSVARPAESPGLVFVGAVGDARLSLRVAPARPGENTIEATVEGADREPLGQDARVLVRLHKLDEEVTSPTVTLLGIGAGRYASPDPVLLPSGWWELEVVLRRRGVLDRTVSFPLRLGAGPAPASDSRAVRLLADARAAMHRLRAWREVEQIADGAGGMGVAHLELVRPDRMRVRTSAGTEVIFIGTARFLRDAGGAWRLETLARPVPVEGALQYLVDAQGVVLGRTGACGGEDCQVVLWEAPGRAAAFAGWIGTRTLLVHRILMVAPSHFMTATLGDFDAPIRVEPPR
ncbi:MAG: copper resistance protein CopC [Armatimonadota bacterium]|nr:copper resistance protein CopC [Armatimonadota bacterium]MDR7454086.1 copper resistance protein CopC [Armatimonadota bacterium]MDR7455796.1 copper resistance protein CopC [Armatimonadota bacterium]MDR7496420.1 copper resistance protein CopC [Armatimonadota bacterium]MDR7511457.1 copper resistance protein CopC [Armatimonadota bacterium]